MIVDVTNKNLHDLLPQIKQSIEQAAFVSIDLEFLGLPSLGGEGSISLFDTPEQRYEKLCNVIRKFPPCQLGLVCFKNEKSYTADVYCITLFKRLSHKEISISPTAADFLLRHNFDFNKFIAEGATYCNRSELSKWKKDIECGEFDFSLLGEDFYDRVETTKIRIILEAEKEDRRRGDADCWQNVCDTVHIKKPLCVDLVGANAIFDRPLAQLEEAALAYALKEEFPHLNFTFSNQGTTLNIQEDTNNNNSQTKTEWKEVVKRFVHEICGVSEIFYFLTKANSPLVVHNSLLDLLHIYNCFEAYLPKTYAEWKQAVHSLFPVIIDTKHLAKVLQKELDSRGCHELTLESLGAFVNSDDFPKSLQAPKVSITDYGRISSHGIEGSANYHNAAFDAFITGDVFLKLSHLFVSERCLFKPDQWWSLRKLIMACRSEVLNRIPIPLIDADCCNLGGVDESGHRPDIIRIVRRGQYDSRPGVYNIWISLQKWLAGPPEIHMEELESVREELLRVFGSFRVGIRMGLRNRSLEIATNSPLTYARVCAYFTSRQSYDIVGDAGLTFEQRLCAPRIEKDRALDFSAKTSDYGFRGLMILSVFVAVVWSGWRILRCFRS